ncbi:MAG TPA: intradiol ring-cleavage dioxygenase [Polyangiaceae bacterium]|jgi:protocatechuate 3,4-dioxygenase beta subunit
MHDHKDPFDQGLQHDLAVLNQLADRRRVLRWLASASLVPVFGCSGTSNSAGATGAAGATDGASGAATAGAGAGSTDTTTCSKIPEETAGPYPGDGSNGPQILTESGVVRGDITTSFGALSGTAEGVPFTIQLKIVAASGCANLAGYAVYVWHCDRDGQYSMYTAADQNYLRGVQETDSDGVVTFKSTFPGCYSGRWPHVHFEVYKSLQAATVATNKLATSQLALPKAQCSEVYGTAGYEASVANLAQISLATDMVFSDGADSETPTTTGNVSDGYVATLTVGVAG